jgi:pyrrolysine biosynthesis protein PylC
MHIAIVGGKLQGTEAAYLANKAGWEVTVIDNRAQPPARGLCHHFRQLDVCREGGFQAAVKNVDMIVPALEDRAALQALSIHCHDLDVPLIFDEKAYRISSSKLRSNVLFKNTGMRLPAEWPDCGFPVIAKPSQASGSHGVCMLVDINDYGAFRSRVSEDVSDWVLQQYLDGPSYSLEVIGRNGRYVPLQITELEMDENYDCKKVIAPSTLAGDLKDGFNAMAVTLASAMALDGIMDVEVILNDGQLWVLEIDARLPSQTPTAVFWSSGCNLLALLWEMISGRSSDANIPANPHCVIYEHIHVIPGKLEIAGEHLMADPGPLHMVADFFGADEALTNYVDGKEDWVATLITADSTLAGVHTKRNTVLTSICQRFGIEHVKDSTPSSKLHKPYG